jgi:hypothetical protein
LESRNIEHFRGVGQILITDDLGAKWNLVFHSARKGFWGFATNLVKGLSPLELTMDLMFL